MQIRQFITGASLILLTACSKKSQTDDNPGSGTTSIDLQLKATNTSGALSRVQGGTLTWTSGTAHARLLKFEAKRGGSEVEFSRTLNQTINPFTTTPVLGNISVDSGTYNEIEVKAYLNPNGGTPALELQGSYVSNGATTPVRFLANEELLLKAERHNVTLSGGPAYQAIAPLNLSLATANITGSSFDNATRTSGTIVISAVSNTSLYNTVVQNLRGSSHGECGFHR